MVTYVYHEPSNDSYLHIYDAKDLKLEARVKLPQRVPYGFHGSWISGGQLKE